MSDNSVTVICVCPDLLQLGDATKLVQQALSRSDSSLLQNDYRTELASLLGLRKNLPVAALEAAGRDLNQEGYWLRADPVHLTADRDKLYLTHHITDLASDEQQALSTLFARYYADDAMQWHLFDDGVGYLNMPTQPGIMTTPLASAMGFDVDRVLPQGEQQMPWHRFMNEIQMMLHDCPVNQQRQHQGKQAINSVWFWGEGEPVPTTLMYPMRWVNGDTPLAAGIAHWLDVPLLPVDHSSDGGGIVLLNERSPASNARQLDSMVNALKQRRIDQLYLLTETHQFQVQRSHLRRWWRRTRPLQYWSER